VEFSNAGSVVGQPVNTRPSIGRSSINAPTTSGPANDEDGSGPDRVSGFESEYQMVREANIARRKELEKQLHDEWVALGHDFAKTKPDDILRARRQPKGKAVLNGPPRRPSRWSGPTMCVSSLNLSATILLAHSINQIIYCH
jgi:hypothetical protein